MLIQRLLQLDDVNLNIFREVEIVPLRSWASEESELWWFMFVSGTLAIVTGSVVQECFHECGGKNER